MYFLCAAAVEQVTERNGFLFKKVIGTLERLFFIASNEHILFHIEILHSQHN